MLPWKPISNSGWTTQRCVLTGTVHLIALVLACCPTVTLPRHGDALHLATAAGKLPRAAALLWKTARDQVKHGYCGVTLHFPQVLHQIGGGWRKNSETPFCEETPMKVINAFCHVAAKRKKPAAKQSRRANAQPREFFRSTRWEKWVCGSRLTNEVRCAQPQTSEKSQTGPNDVNSPEREA